MSTTTTNATKEKKSAEIEVVYQIDNETIRLTPSIVQNYIVGNNNGRITMQEFKFFTELCKARKLNPFLKEAYCIKFGDAPAQLVVSKDVLIKRAATNKNYDGMESGIIVISKNGDIKERAGTFKLKDEELVGGWARVYRKDWKYPTYCSVSLDEVAQRKKDGSLNTNWANKSATMVEKVAKARALRDTFVELGGMYDADEISQPVVNDDIIDQPEPVIINEPEDISDNNIPDNSIPGQVDLSEF